MIELRAHEALDVFLTQRGIRNGELAERIQLLRRHPTIPSAAEVSHWRRGRSVPQHDMRIWIELATEGALPAETWAAEKQRRKQEKHNENVQPK